MGGGEGLQLTSAGEEALAIGWPAPGKSFLGGGLPTSHTTGVSGGLFLLTGSHLQAGPPSMGSVEGLLRDLLGLNSNTSKVSMKTALHK